jgi:hypothetical protein
MAWHLYQVTMMPPRGASPLRYNDAIVGTLAAEVLTVDHTAPGASGPAGPHLWAGIPRRPRAEAKDGGPDRRRMAWQKDPHTLRPVFPFAPSRGGSEFVNHIASAVIALHPPNRHE